jgi:hypothetical protein
MLRWTVGEMDPSAPGKPPGEKTFLEAYRLLGCATRCWENTQYVSKHKCAGDTACLCGEPDYQNVSWSDRTVPTKEALEQIELHALSS